VGLQEVFGSQIYQVLSLCSNYIVRIKYLLDEAAKLVGINAKVRWFLKRTPSVDLDKRRDNIIELWILTDSE